jgi:chorismate dehydratase
MRTHHTLACVSFLNSKPLIEALAGRPDLDIRLAVPSELLGIIERGEADTGLLSIVDYQLSKCDLLLVPAGAIGCDGPTLTVRLFSKVPARQITDVHGDTDSHTSVILAQVILREAYGVAARVLPLTAHPEDSPDGPQAMLLIGDKVVNAAPDGDVYKYQLDLGEEWKRLTGLPFVFACWMMRADAVDLELADGLAWAQKEGAKMTEALLDKYAADKHWPRDLARRYFTEYLRYEVTPRGRMGIERFFELAGKCGLLDVKRKVRYLELG